MSHYAVAVFSDDGDFDRLLAPYNEADHQYFVFKPVEFDQIRADYDRFKKQNPRWTLEMYIKEFGYECRDGQWGTSENPNGYWDYYSLDGKDYLYDLKPDAEPEEDEYYFRKNDYDWYPADENGAEEYGEFWDDFIGENAVAEPPGLWNREYYRERYQTREQYIKEMLRKTPYAFITPDGVWHAPGRVGWFATSDDTAESYNRYLEEWDAFLASDGNPYVSLVDCHI